MSSEMVDLWYPIGHLENTGSATYRNQAELKAWARGHDWMNVTPSHKNTFRSSIANTENA